jgi:thiol-disulfide isomerase/thioredoxin
MMGMTDVMACSALFADDPYQVLMEGVTALAYLGRESLDGAECNRLEFTEEEADWQLWIQAGEQPLPRKVVADLSRGYDGMWFEAAGAESVKMELTIRFDDWLVNADLPEEQFVFVPPEEAEEVESFFGDLFFEPDRIHPLVGRSAPSFWLDLLDGGELNLAQHKGRDIVILDFWATWCAPCIEALPVLIEVAEAYRDLGVAFYAVNEEEDPQMIRTFLELKRLSLTVPLDREGRVGRLYGVDGIPQTVLIGRDGTVQAVHVGFIPDLKERLAEELDALLAGVNLAEQELARVEGIDEGESLERVWETAGTYTIDDYREAALAAGRAELVEGYRQSGSRNEAWDEQAIQLIEMCLQVYARMPGAATMPELQQAGQALIDLGCDDPLVLYGFGYALDRQDHHRSGEQYLRAAVEGLIESEYPRTQLGAAASRFARYLEAWDRHDEARQFHQIAADAFLEGARTSGHEWFDQRDLTNMLFLQVREYLPADIAESFTERLAGLEGVDPCTLHTVLGKYHIRVAWDVRGGGYARTVTDEGWVGFQHQMETARDHFEEAYRLDPSRPEAPTEMIVIAMAGHAREGDDERLWFERAIQAQIDWPRAFSNFMWALRPRWGGSHEAMYRFGLECMNSGRYDTDVPFQLIQALLEIAEDGDGSFDFWVLRDVYAVADEVLTSLAADPAHAHRAREFATLAAGIAWGTERYEEAGRAIETLGGSWDDTVLGEMRVTRRRILDDVAVFTSPVAQQVVEADEALRWDRADLAVERYQAALAATTDPVVISIVHDRLVTATVCRDFQNGDWVPLTFERGLPGWRIRGGAWHSSAPSTIKGGPKRDGLRLICQAPVGNRFELQGRIDMEKLMRRSKKTNAGIFFRYREYLDRSDWQSFLIYNAEKRAWIGYRFWKPKGEYISLRGSVKRSFDFHLQVWDEHAALYLNGELVFAGLIVEGEDWRPGRLFGLAGSYGGRDGYVKFESLELHRLTEPPEALTAALGTGQEQ